MYRHIIHFVVQAYKSPAVSSVTTCRSYIRCCRRCYRVVWRMETHTMSCCHIHVIASSITWWCPLYHIFIYGDHYFCNIVYPPFERWWYNWFKRQAIAFAFEYKQPNTAQIYFSINVVVSVMLFNARRELLLSIFINRIYIQGCILLFGTNCIVWMLYTLTLWCGCDDTST